MSVRLLHSKSSPVTKLQASLTRDSTMSTVMTTERTAAAKRAQWTAASLRFRRLLTCRSPAVRAMSAMVVSPRDQAQSVDADLQLDVTHAGVGTGFGLRRLDGA